MLSYRVSLGCVSTSCVISAIAEMSKCLGDNEGFGGETKRRAPFASYGPLSSKYVRKRQPASRHPHHNCFHVALKRSTSTCLLINWRLHAEVGRVEMKLCPHEQTEADRRVTHERKSPPQTADSAPANPHNFS